ncbi:hypothetical protein [Sphingomonas sp. Leaf62]|uniref:hypothetical protein n=1 Tax=Sphingomonas sp. Leaf62 TaxID=1736228 RepID=UPI0006F579D1|nr:hypothetical protein [Sphingomonas sp. Leaf62]KQN71762.1 hypothetical protein ASE91_03330 [Sphingomonas sp. Leaf62]
MTGLSVAHRDALARMAGVLRAATEPWWVIAGAAVALHSRRPVTVGDIDILIGIEDVALIRELPGVRVRAPDDNGLFRSRFYAALEANGVEIECMAGFELHRAGRREQVRPRSRVFVEVGEGLAVPVPDRADMVAMLTRFGREKDMARIALLNG